MLIQFLTLQIRHLFEGSFKYDIVILRIKLTKLTSFDFDYNRPQYLFGGGVLLTFCPKWNTCSRVSLIQESVMISPSWPQIT